jgi:hypothetical protein
LREAERVVHGGVNKPGPVVRTIAVLKESMDDGGRGSRRSKLFETDCCRKIVRVVREKEMA